ncbi:MAG: hypothetical protein JRG73_20060 [Deltaproteobacteria bacterium]|nr:hypothetical protein [Deltaproteobacteria bacterium]
MFGTVGQEKLFPNQEHPSTAAVTEEIVNQRWPRGGKRTARAAVDASLYAYQRWMQHLRRATLVDSRIHAYRIWLLDILPTPHAAIVDWFEEVRKRVAWRRDFSGDLKHYTWSVRHPWWGNIGRQWADIWGHSPELWDELLEALGED